MGGSSKKQTVGYRYYMDLHMGICYGPVDRIRKILWGDRQAWAGDQDANGTITINSPELFGGDENEGGVKGSMHVMMGAQTQTLPGAVAAKLPSPSPAFRGILSLFYSGQVSANNPYIKPVAPQVERILEGWHGGAAWYPEKAPIPLVGSGSVGEPAEELVFSVLSDSPTATDLQFYSVPGTGPSSGHTMLSPGVRFNSYQTNGGFSNETLLVANEEVPPIPRNFAIEFEFKNEGNPTGGRAYIASQGINPDYGWSGAWAVYLYSNQIVFTSNSLEDETTQSATINAIDRANWHTYRFEKIGTTISSYVDGVLRGSFLCLDFDIETSPQPLAINGPYQLVALPNEWNNGASSYRNLKIFEVSDGSSPDAVGMNPAHIIYQCLTDPVWGMGYPTTTIGTTFASAADTLFAEGFGLCMIWNKAEEIGAFVRQVLDHIGGVMYVDPKTGLFELKLLRGDYDAETLPVFDESNVVALESFQRVGYGDTVNEISVVYRDVSTNKDTPVTVQNLANIQAQGGVVSQTKQYPGLPTGSLALRVAQRDLLAASTPLAKGRMKVNRQAWNIAPGGVFVLTWPKLGIESIVMRVLGIGYGTLRDGTITVEIAEDVFGLPAASYAEQEDSGWTEPSTKPVPVVQQTVAEVPYRSLVSELTATELAAVDQDAAYFSVLAARPSGLAQAFDIWSRVGSASFEQQATGAFVPGAALNGAITATTTEIDLESAADLQLVTAGSLAIIGTGRDAEWVLVEEIDTGALSMTVSRGMLDTVPKAHADGARVWFDDARDAPEQIERATGETADFKLATISTGGTLDIGLAGAFSATAAQRQFRPYPPGALTIGGQTYPAALTDTQPALTWAHRDRLQQTADFIEQSEGNIGPEAGVTYSVLITNADTAAVLASATGLTGTSYTPGAIFGQFSMRVQVWAVRDGVESWQRHDHTLAYTFLRRLDAENGNNLLTETGDYINGG
jgi:hypothetical protein